MDFRIRADSKGTNSKEIRYEFSNLTTELLIYPSGHQDSIRIFKDVQITPVLYVIGEYGNESSLYLRSYASHADIICIENNRKDIAPLFTFQISGQITLLQRAQPGFENAISRNFEAGLTMRLGVDTWIDQLKKASLIDYKLLQLPVSIQNNPVDDIRKSIDAAYTLFYQGGSHGYNSCAVKIRTAMEKTDVWLKIPPYDSNWRKDEASFRERLYLNWHSVKKLLQLAAHETHEWHRDEAQYVLAASVSLMNALITVKYGETAL